MWKQYTLIRNSSGHGSNCRVETLFKHDDWGALRRIGNAFQHIIKRQKRCWNCFLHFTQSTSTEPIKSTQSWNLIWYSWHHFKVASSWIYYVVTHPFSNKTQRWLVYIQIYPTGETKSHICLELVITKNLRIWILNSHFPHNIAFLWAHQI